SQHAADLLFQHRRVFEFSLGCQGEQLLVGNGAPQEERQARGQFQVADAIGGIGRDVGRVVLDTKDEFWTGDDAADAHLDSLLESAFITASLVERQEALHVFVIHGAAVGAAREVRKNSAGAG